MKTQATRSLRVLAILAAVLSLTFAVHATLPLVLTGTWQPAGTMVESRSGAASALLPDGRLLLIGGTANGAALGSAEAFGASGGFTAIASMNEARNGHSATVLADGRVLVAGGSSSGGATATAELYDPASDTWSATGVMGVARSGHSASLLSDGRVLIAGGDSSAGPVASLEIYDPSTGVFTAAGSLANARSSHAAAVLKDGSVLIAGGHTADGDGNAVALASVEIVDAATGTASGAASLSTPRNALTATTLLDGRVFVAGGNDGAANGGNDLASAEVYDPATGSWSAAASMASARSGHMAFLLPDNNSVLLVGGSASGADLASAELYQPWNDAVKATGAMSAPRPGSSGSAIGAEGLLLVAGGAGQGTAELYRFATVWTDADDYAPGTTVYISGTGWKPNEIVTLSLRELPNLDPHNDWVTIADDQGNINDFSWAPDSTDLNQRFYLTAKGEESQAQNTFTDSKPATVTIGAQTPNPINPGSSSTYSITVNFNGNSDSCTSPLSVSTALPTGATASFSPSSVTSTGGNAASTLTISTTGATPLGSTSFTVLAANGGGTCQSGTASNNTGVLNVGRKLAFTTAAFSEGVNQCSNAITVQSQTHASAASAVAGNVTVGLSSSAGTGGFYSDNACTTSATSTTITTGNSTSNNFYYKDSAAGGPTLTASATNYISAAQVETIVAAPPAPSIPDLNNGDDHGSSANDNVTNLATGLRFSGTSQGNATINLYIDGSSTSSATGTANGPGNWNNIAVAGPVSEGLHTIKAKATDTFGNDSPQSASLAFTIDLTAPTMGMTPAAGTYNAPFSVSWGITDPLSGGVSSGVNTGTCSVTVNAVVVSTSCSGSTLLAPGAPRTVVVTAQDVAGNTGSDSRVYTVNADATPPVITPNVSGTLGNNGWYTSNVDVSFTVTDAQSAVTSRSASCTTDATTTTISSDTPGTLISCTAVSSGGSNTVSVTIKRDATAPSASLAVSAGTAGTNGWYTSDVTVHVSGTDSTSGIASCTADQNQTTETTGTSFNGSCTDNAGNVGNAAPLSVKLDKTGPSATLTPSGTLGNNGWYTGNVTITTTGSDSISSPVTCSADQHQNTDTTGAPFNGSCTNDAGLSTNAAQISVKRDATKPTATATPDRGADHNGWYNHALSVSYSGSDATSGLAGCSSDSNYSGPDSASASVSGTCTDKAGNVSDPASYDFKYDATAPSAGLSVTAGTAGTNGWYTSDVTVHTSGTDNLSGIDSCSVDQFQTTETAGQAFNGSCTDEAGNTGNAAPLSVKLDKTGPSATLTPSGTLGDNNWYISNVTIATTGADSISSPVSCTADQHQTTDTGSATFNGSCTNDAGLSTNAAEITVKRDATKPTATATPDRGADHNGWYNHSLTVTYSGADSTSGIASCDAASVYSGPDSAAASVSGACKDYAGNVSDPAAYDFKYDATTPSASLSVTVGTAGTNGWYTSDVTVHTSGTDNLGGSVTCTADQFQTTETAGQEFNGTCDDEAGNTGHAVSLTVKLDKTGPSATLTPSGTLGDNGWYISDVTITTTGADSISSPVSCTADQHQTTDTTGADFNGSCTNDAGLSTNAASVTIKRDATAPTAALSVTAGTAGTNGWYTSDVTVHTAGTDATSGIVSCTADQFQTTETAGTAFNGMCKDNAGNTTNAASLTVKLDKTGPSAALSVTAGTLGNNGWYVSDVTVHTSGADGISAPVSCTVDQYQTTDTTGHIFTGSCMNDAGLSTSAVTLTIKLDKTKPTLSPSLTAPVLLNGSYTATSGAADATSGLASQSCGPVVTGTVGAKVLTCNATDNAGNTNSANLNYSVVYATGGACLGSPGHQILQPINVDGTSVSKQGSTVPAKFRVCDANGNSIGTPGVVASFWYMGSTFGSSDPINEFVDSTTPDTAFRWSATDQQWIYNVSTKGYQKGLKHYFRINLNDGSTIDFAVTLK